MQTALNGQITTAETNIKTSVEKELGDSQGEILNRVQQFQDYITEHFFDEEVSGENVSVRE